MKKFAIFILLIIAVVSTISYLYLNNIFINRNAQKENVKFEIYQNQEITGSELTTLINRAIDYNEKNEIEKDNSKNYINNDTNSLKIDIKFIDDDVIYSMEKIYNNDINKFLAYYSDINFKCNEVQYHNSTGKIKYMLFEQITQ